jgi:hypothetical protein
MQKEFKMESEKIKCTIKGAELIFRCPICERVATYHTLYLEAFRDFGFDCPLCFKHFDVEFVNHNDRMN